jgi:hypothetical protein
VGVVGRVGATPRSLSNSLVRKDGLAADRTFPPLEASGARILPVKAVRAAVPSTKGTVSTREQISRRLRHHAAYGRETGAGELDDDAPAVKPGQTQGLDIISPNPKLEVTEVTGRVGRSLA